MGVEHAFHVVLHRLQIRGLLAILGLDEDILQFMLQSLELRAARHHGGQLVAGDLALGEVTEAAAPFEQHEPVADGIGVVRVVGDEDDAQAALARFEAAYAPDARDVDRLDGLSLDFGDWRANVRVSNTEGLLRLNVETRGDRDLLAEKVAELRAFLA